MRSFVISRQFNQMEERTNENSISLNKYLSSSGICSRRDADKWIKDGRVMLNDKVGQLGNRVFEGDLVTLDGKPIQTQTQALYIAFNKPVGIVCTTDPKEPENIIKYINHPERLFPIGRLDKPSQGLIFLTNDGDIVNKILRAGNNHEKEYIVSVNRPITSDFIARMGGGIEILGTVTKECVVDQVSKFVFRIVLTQGLNRQIRRMCKQLGYGVTKLIRVRIMNVNLGNLEEGQWRNLTGKEIQQINELIASSSKTEEASVDVRKKVNTSPKKGRVPKRADNKKDNGGK